MMFDEYEDYLMAFAATENGEAKMRLIDADALEEDIQSWAVVLNKPEILSKKDTVCLIEHAPTINPESLVRHGRWETSSDTEEIIKEFICSICGENLSVFDAEVCWPGQNCYFFCPNCGAKMDLEKEGI